MWPLRGFLNFVAFYVAKITPLRGWLFLLFPFLLLSALVWFWLVQVKYYKGFIGIINSPETQYYTSEVSEKNQDFRKMSISSF